MTEEHQRQESLISYAARIADELQTTADGRRPQAGQDRRPARWAGR